nr:PAS domain S-box protein [Nostoc sp. EkiNYC01]
MLTNSLSFKNLQMTIIRHPLIVSPEILVLDVVTLINQTRGNVADWLNKDSKPLEDSTKEINSLTSQADSCVLVMENSKLLGIFTQRDLIKLTAEKKSLENVKIEEVMTTELVTLKIREFKDIFTALNLLKQHRIRHLPILGEQGEVIGLVTPASLLGVAIQQARLYNYARVKLRERQRIETELRLERNLVSAILNVADALMIVLDFHGRIIRFNHTCEATTGYSFDEVKGKFIWDVLLLPEKTECIKALFENFAHRELPNRYETDLITKDGDRRIISWSNNFLLNHHDQIEYIVCTGIDITESRKVQEELQQTRNFLASMINNLPIAVFVKDAKPESFGTFKLWNQTCERIFGITAQEAISKTDYEFFPKEQADFFRQKDQEAFSSGIPQDIYEETLDSPNLGPRILHTTKIPLYDKNQQPEYLLCICEDITEYKQAEAALKESEQKFIYSIGIVKDIQNQKQGQEELKCQLAAIEAAIERERLVNMITQRIRESLDLQAILNATVVEVHKFLKVDRVLIFRTFPDGIGKVIAEALTPGYESIVDRSFPVQCLPKECYSRYVQGETYAFYDRNLRQSPSCLIKFMEDMQIPAKLVIPIIQHDVLWGLLIAHQCSHPREWKSVEIELLQQLGNQLAIATQQSGLYAQLQVELNERKKAEEQIFKALEKEKELSDLKSRFISMTSHEFRTPLAVIASSAGILKSFSHKLDEQQKQRHLQCIQTYVQHITQLLDNILLINKAEAGKLIFEPIDFDLVGFCRTLIDELQLIFPNHHLVFSPQYQGSSSDNNHFIVYMDNQLLRQILSNLLSNAVKYSSIGSNIQIDLLIEDQIVVFLIKDEGIGISLEDQQHLFESFYRGNNVGNTPGTGLGLTIVNKCVYIQKGRITFASRVGVGTTFRVELPLIVTDTFS